jgi:hypothetical protein
MKDGASGSHQTRQTPAQAERQNALSFPRMGICAHVTGLPGIPPESTTCHRNAESELACLTGGVQSTVSPQPLTQAYRNFRLSAIKCCSLWWSTPPAPLYSGSQTS